MIENKTREFKREYMNNIKYAVVAFANTAGGSGKQQKYRIAE